MQQTLINQIEDLIDNLHRNKNDNMEFRMVFGHDFKSRLTVLFGEEFDKISNQLEELIQYVEKNYPASTEYYRNLVEYHKKQYNL